MDKQIFENRLKEAGESAVSLARDSVINELSDNLIFKILPNNLDLSEHLTNFEKRNLIERKKEINRTFTTKEVVDRLLIDNKVPVWINCSLIKSSIKVSTVELLISRRFRDDKELYHQEDRFPPFKVALQIPPYLSIASGQKFDINWKFRRLQTAYKIWKSRKKIKT
ncbi:hypothetical protein ES705_45851 [subsurface metagenome]